VSHQFIFSSVHTLAFGNWVFCGFFAVWEGGALKPKGRAQNSGSLLP
jgi:hypothetical protein